MGTRAARAAESCQQCREFVHAPTVVPASTTTIQVYFCVGFVTSPRLLAFWAISFTMGLFALTLFLACASLMRKIPTANALQVRGSEAHVVCLAIFCAPRSAAAVCVWSQQCRGKVPPSLLCQRAFPT